VGRAHRYLSRGSFAGVAISRPSCVAHAPRPDTVPGAASCAAFVCFRSRSSSVPGLAAAPLLRAGVSGVTTYNLLLLAAFVSAGRLKAAPTTMGSVHRTIGSGRLRAGLLVGLCLALQTLSSISCISSSSFRARAVPRGSTG
jgi:hypothetical protein